MATREYIRNWERCRTAKLNARGLTSRGTPMKQRRRVYGRAKTEYQRMVRGQYQTAGLTVKGTVPKRLLAQKWAAFRASMQTKSL